MRNWKTYFVFNKSYTGFHILRRNLMLNDFHTIIIDFMGSCCQTTLISQDHIIFLC